MLVHTEVSLANFQFWGGAKDFAQELTIEDLEQIEFVLEDIYPDGMDETLVNDIFWFETDWLCECLGYEDYEDFLKQRAA
jgi:hypothetical protein